MTSLIEKALIIGFGIFIASIFISFIGPFLGHFLDYNNGLEDNLSDYIRLINDVDEGVLTVIDNRDYIYQKEIYYPESMNISIEDNYINFRYRIQDDTSDITIKYEIILKSCSFHNLAPNNYFYKVYFESNFIKIEIK